MTRTDRRPEKLRFFPCGRTRREFVWEMGAGFCGLALASQLAGDGFFARHGHAADPPSRDGPLTPKPPPHATRVKSCIFLMMNGAPSQVDTFDYKPELEKYSGTALPDDKKYINSGGRKVGFLTANWRRFRPGGESGLMISDYFPNVRKHADKLAVINSCQADSHAHGSALVGMNTAARLSEDLRWGVGVFTDWARSTRVCRDMS